MKLKREIKQELLISESKNIKKVLQKIDRVDTKLHRIILSGYVYDYRSIQQLMGCKIKVLESRNTRRANYATYGVINIRGSEVLTVFLNPINKSYMTTKGVKKTTNYPWYIFEYNYPTKQFLVDSIDSVFEDVVVSSLEYSIDIFTKSNKQEDIEHIYNTLAKYIYFPYQRDCMKYATEDDENEVCRQGKGIWYTRGQDKNKIKKKGHGWKKEDIDRIRVEFRAEKQHLKKLNIRKLRDFIKRSPVFQSMIENRFKFKRFNSLNLFQEQVSSSFLTVKKYHMNNYYSEVVEELNELKNKMVSAMRMFDEDWFNYGVEELGG